MNKEINLQNSTEDDFDYEDIVSVEDDFDYEDIVSVEDDCEDIVSAEGDCEDIISVENDDEFIVVVEDDYENIIIVEDDYDDIDGVEDPQDYCIGGYYRVKIGETFCNRYIVKRKLGWGQYSTVWLCWDQRNMQLIALKIMKSAPKTTAAAMVEIELLQHIRLCDPDGVHKSKIVKLLDHFRVNGIYGTHVCIVFEVLGEDIYKHAIRSGDGGLPLTKVKRIIKQVLEALDYLHTTCQIIHTDIKPDNICLVDNAPEELMAVTIADLGNGCWVNRHFSAIIQSSAYRCPEVLLGEDYGPKADIWSTACTAFDLATGDFLFPAHAEESSAEDSLHVKAILKLLGGKPKRGMLFEMLKNTLKYFTRRGKLCCYPKVKARRIIELLTNEYGWDEKEAYTFSEFLLPMLTIDPNKRSSAKDSLKHQWLQF